MLWTLILAWAPSVMLIQDPTSHSAPSTEHSREARESVRDLSVMRKSFDSYGRHALEAIRIVPAIRRRSNSCPRHSIDARPSGCEPPAGRIRLPHTPPASSSSFCALAANLEVRWQLKYVLAPAFSLAYELPLTELQAILAFRESFGLSLQVKISLTKHLPGGSDLP